MLANALKTTGLAALLGLGVIAASGNAEADMYKTRCYGDDCVQLRCDDWGRGCFRIGQFDRNAPTAVEPQGYTETYREYPDSYYAPPPPDDGYNNGYDTGYEKGYQNGYDSGYDDSFPGS